MALTIGHDRLLLSARSYTTHPRVAPAHLAEAVRSAWRSAFEMFDAAQTARVKSHHTACRVEASG